MRILLVEDNPGDRRLAEEMLRQESGGVPPELHAVADGEEAIRFLHRDPPFEDAPRPDLVLLDLNLPGMDGREVLRLLKSDEALKAIPVVVLTSSGAAEDVAASYQLHANCYVRKAAGFDEGLEILGAVRRFWLETARLPER